ncbi:zf-HC2 domain-containing protein [Actinoplanes bogorensis]|uniref:Zf-HC2 domain-containing protein n=1 Tax=Paractinoplanes bogorensis TaxID=1610840 RepID=A0ABS5YWM8_9ACTN|nr:zf-HC2 domain-containing protein [Actinoplanes bogorensis]MBU2667778.1 zf-HC2 domain-containing protein [Actinoplanes bogorensis]
MACERWREMLSAQLDGEDDPAERPAVDAHLAECAGCREWLDRAASVNRLTSTSMTAPPDLTAAILAALPTRDAVLPGVGDRAEGWRGRLRRFPVAIVLTVALAVVGAVQLILGLNQIGGGVVGAHVHTGLDATPGHLWHESAAWNVAVGAGYLFIALRRTRPSGLVPMLTAFVGMLLLLSVNDLTAARVDATRLISHGFVILGYLLIVALSRIPGGFVSTPPGARSSGGAWRAAFGETEEDEPATTSAVRPGLRLVPPGPMTAHHDERHAA